MEKIWMAPPIESTRGIYSALPNFGILEALLEFLEPYIFGIPGTFKFGSGVHPIFVLISATQGAML